MWRIRIVCLVLILGYVGIVCRLFYWQVIASDRLRLEAASQYYIQLPLPAQRGSIYASDKSPLVINQPAYLVFASPKSIDNALLFSERISGVLGGTKESIFDSITRPGRVWVPLAHKVESEKADALKLLGLSGLGFEKEPKRFYPEASMAARVVGFVGSDDNGKDTGYFGLEGYYNQELGGKDGMLEIEKDAKGNPIAIGIAKRIESQDGRSLVLWLDRTIQYAVEQKLLDGITKYGAKEGSVVVMDPKTGGILAMASFPGYDQRIYAESDRALYKNPVVGDSYEPGSTFKVMVMSSALDKNVITPLTQVDESGPVKVGEYYIRTWDNKYHGTLTMTQVLEHSSNVGMVSVQKKLGNDAFIDTIHRFGFGEQTNVDLQDETSPSLRDDRDWKEIDLATASFGQGIAVTPLQMVRAVGALANDGWLMEPHVVKDIRDGDGRLIPIRPKKIRQVVSSAAAQAITEMMVNAVDSGEAKWAKPKGYRIAGKTGTAQIPVAGHYDDKKTIASFVGFAPSDNPRFVMLVTLREPTSSPWGSETAAPLFFSIARDIFAYYGIAPQ